MTLEMIVEKSKKNPEIAQGLMRVVIASSITFVLFLAQFFYTDFYQHILIASSFYLIYSIVWFVWVYSDDGKYVYRRVLGILSDMAILSYGIENSNIVAASLYPIILWVIIANGYRYGTRYLYMALGVAVFLFLFTTHNNPSWGPHQELIAMMTVGLIVLPLLFSQLLDKVTKLNIALSEKADDLEYRLYHDSLTKLGNREALNLEIVEGEFHSITLIDVNNFSHFNDLYGTDMGNDILINLSKFLTKLAYQHGLLVYRIGGDSFVFLQKEQIEREALDRKIETILEALDSCQVSLSKMHLKLNVNFTVVWVNAQEKALEKANMTLYHARKNGEKFWKYDESLNRHKEVENILFWEKEIHDAIVEDRIVPVFHPIVNGAGKIVKYETLMRMKRKVEGKTKLFSPFEFLEIAIETNQYEKLTTIMIEKSFATMKDIEGDFSINLTFSNIQNKNMVMFLKSKIDEYAIGDRLILEIVESEDIYNFEIVKTFVAYLRLFGVRFAIDDFGSGYSNYKHIFEVMPEYIKIDGSLIQHIDRDENAQKFVESIVVLSKNLGVKTIAEFVHNEMIFDIVKQLGVDEFQGSYFSKPLSVKKLNKI